MTELKTTAEDRDNARRSWAPKIQDLATDIDTLLAANAVLTEEIARLRKQLCQSGRPVEIRIQPGTYKAGDISAALRTAEPQPDPRHAPLWNALAVMNRGRR